MNLLKSFQKSVYPSVTHKITSENDAIPNHFATYLVRLLLSHEKNFLIYILTWSHFLCKKLWRESQLNWAKNEATCKLFKYIFGHFLSLQRRPRPPREQWKGLLCLEHRQPQALSVFGQEQRPPWTTRRPRQPRFCHPKWRPLGLLLFRVS